MKENAPGVSQNGGTPPEAVLAIPQTKQGAVARLVTIFGSLGITGDKRVHYVFDAGDSDYREIVRPGDRPLDSIARSVPAAAWYEREIHDQYGIEFVGQPDPRPLIFHDNWPDAVHPMVDPVDDVPWSNREYRFLQVEGEGIAEVAVGPVHAGVIEPGHFRFSVVGDTVLHLELRHFYTHKGTEKLFEGSSVAAAAMLAESVSGDNCFAHAACYSQAVENAYGIDIPARASAIRLIGLELERLVCHISDVGGLCTDVGFGVAAAYAARIKESLLQASSQCCGTRYWRGIAAPGGLRFDFDSSKVFALSQCVAQAHRDFSDLARLILETPSIQNRFETAGILSLKAARDLAVVGVVARASGMDLDVRRNHPYGRYGLYQFEVPVTHYGDVMARAKIRIAEAAISARLIQETAAALPEGSVSVPILVQGEVRSSSAVESPRGELYYWLEARDGKLTRCHIKSPSFQNWPAMPPAVAGNIIADFPLINKSFNLSYSGCDR
ncbi:MAG TPA: NADH-quinone oxidoreductase subunit C [Candidatus Dormibacteraeota bacterium]|nr:NADH-quinone oxidoreductase subunit C [Candidatus Dormibacteraeota bacterium]